MAQAPANIVSSLGNGEYRITFVKPMKFDMQFFFLAGTHNMRVLMKDKNSEKAIGVEGKRETLLDWLRSLGGITEEAMKSYEDAMTD